MALAIVHFPTEHHTEGSRLLTEELRGRDVIGAYGPTAVLIMMPETTALAARDRLDAVVDRLVTCGLGGICAGITGTSGGGTRTAEALIAEAGYALATARYLGEKSAIWSEPPAPIPATRTVVIAEDDPDVTHIVGAHVRAAGHRAIITLDGEQALAAVRAHAPDVLVLDLMMPNLNGFEVLAQIRESGGTAPRIIVLSGRGREQDVLRAAELGADDYMTKPFDPQELMTRVARLLESGRRVPARPPQKLQMRYRDSHE
jgi:CheY-like chemotaxis protein